MRVLLIEDDEFIAKSLETVLAKENYAVDIAVDGEIGWQLIESVAYDLILLDVVLPKLDGISLCRQIRENNYQTPVLLLTARNSSIDRIAGLDAGADDYMVKPFELPELLARMRVLLRRGSSPVVPILEWNQLQIDPVSCQVTYNAQPLHLTPKEYRLLELFLRKPRHVLTRSAIIEHLWGLEETPGEDTITTHIKGVRQKLKQVGAPANFIETVYGIGYRLQGSNSDSHSTPVAATDPPAASTPAATTPAPKRIQTALQPVWNKYVAKNRNHVQVLQQIINAIGSASGSASEPQIQPAKSPNGRPDTISSEQWQQAQIAAHKLAGTLGIFGYPHGSELALKLEDFFRARQIPSLEDLQTLEQQVNELSAIFNHNLPETPACQNSVLIIIDNDADWVAQIKQLSANHLTQITSIDQFVTHLESCFTDSPSTHRLTHEHSCDRYSKQSSSDQGIENFDTSPFQVALLNLPLTNLSEAHLSLIKSITQQLPPVLTLVFTEQASLDLRVKLARAGIYALLPKLSPEQALNLVDQLRSVTAAKRILLVDDDPQILDTLQSILEPWGLQTNRLEQPLHFWDALQSYDPNLLILDIEMPNYNGIDLCRAVRNTLHWRNLPILFLTAHTDATTVHNALNAGATALLYKSMAQADVVRCVFRSLGEWRDERVKG